MKKNEIIPMLIGFNFAFSITLFISCCNSGLGVVVLLLMYAVISYHAVMHRKNEVYRVLRKMNISIEKFLKKINM